MREQLFKKNIYSNLVFSFEFLFLILFLFSSLAFSQNEPNPTAPIKPTSAELYEDSPNQVGQQKGKWESYFKSHFETVKSTTVNISSTASAFYIAGLLQVMYRMAAEPERDSEMLRNFMTNQVFSTQANLSLAFFIAGVQSTQSIFSNVANKFSWVKNEAHVEKLMAELAKQKNLPGTSEILINSKGFNPKLVEEWKKINLQAKKMIPGNLTSSQFQKLSLLSSFAVVLPLVSVFNDLLSDSDLKYYANSLVATPDEINKMIVEKGYTPFEAHQRAYDRWVTNHKIYDYTPMILSAWTTLSIQMFALPSIARLTSAAFDKLLRSSPGSISNSLIKGVQFTKAATKVLPQGRIAKLVGLSLVFLPINNALEKFFTKIYNHYTYKNKLIEAEAELLKYPLHPALSKECFATLNRKKSFDQKKWNSIPYSVAKKIIDIDDIDSCSNEPLSIEEKIDFTATQFSRWRQLWLEKSLSPLQSWANYISDISQNYQSAKVFYADFIQASREKTNSNLKFSSPYFGLGGISVTNANQKANLIGEIYLTVDKNIITLAGKNKKSNLETDEKKLLDLFVEMMKFLSALNSKKEVPSTLKSKLSEIQALSISKDRENFLIQLLTEEYSAKSLIVFKNFFQNKPELINKYPEYGLLRLNKIISESSKKYYGEPWFYQLKYSAAINDSITFAPTKIKGINVNSKFERFLIDLACGNNEMSYKSIQKYSFWSLNLNLPKLTLGTSDICKKLDLSFNSDIDNTKTIFNSEIKSNGQYYLNLVDYAISQLDPKFLNPSFDIDSWWKETVAASVDDTLNIESAKIKTLFENEFLPSLFEKSSSKGIEKGVLASINSELKLYSDLLSKHTHISDLTADLNLTLKILELLIKYPLDKNKWITEIRTLNMKNSSPILELIEKSYNKSERINSTMQISQLVIDNFLQNTVQKLEKKSLSEEQWFLAKKIIEIFKLRLNEETSYIRLQKLFFLGSI